MFRILLEPAPPDGGGNTDPPEPRPDASLTRRLKEHRGDAAALAGQLFAENRHLQGQLADARGKATPEGAVVLTGDDAAAWAELKGLGKPADVKAGLAERDTLKGQVARHERDRLLAGHGYEAEALGPLLPADATIVEADGPKDREGKPTKVLAVALTGQDKPTPLGEYVDANLARYKPVIGGPDAKAAERPTFRGTPTPPPSRREPPAPGEDRRGEDTRAVAADLRMNVGYGGF